MSDEVERAEQVVARLEDKRAALVQKGIELADERQRLSFAAHAEGDTRARSRLDKINNESAVFASELASVVAAIDEAQRRVEAAKRNADLTADREAAKQLGAELETFTEDAMKIDMALAVVIESGNRMEATLHRMNQLGAQSPNNSQLTTLGALALHSALMQTPWRREFRHLPPNQRQTFVGLVEAWHHQIMQNIERRLGDQTQEAAE